MRTVVRKNKMMNANDLMSSVLNDFLSGEFVSGRREVKWKPAVNVFRTESAFGMDVKLPGYKKEEVGIDLDGRKLIIKSLEAEKKELEVEAKAEVKTLRREFKKTAFELNYILPKTADLNALAAAFENGILKISIPVLEEALPKKIKVEIA